MQTHERSGSLERGDGEVVALLSGRGRQHEPDEERLSQIVDVVNERFGLERGQADQLLVFDGAAVLDHHAARLYERLRGEADEPDARRA